METITKTAWNIDAAHSMIAFKVKYLMISTVTGKFEDFEASVVSENDDFKDAEIMFSAKTASINTYNKERDKHLMSNDFFSAEKYPEITFESKSFDGEVLVGDLTIRDVTKEVILGVDLNGTAVDPYGQTKAGFAIEGTINRKDFDLSWSSVTETGNIIVGDKVRIAIDIQLTKIS